MGQRTRRPARSIERALVVEDDERLRATLVSALEGWAESVRACGTLAEAEVAIAAFEPQLMLLDYKLPDGNSDELLMRLPPDGPRPLIVALSAAASPAESFALSELGVSAYLEKPIDLSSLERALEKVTAEPPDLGLRARAAVGLVDLKQAESDVRDAMVDEALGRSAGNRRGAARLLGVSRQLLQHVLRNKR